MQALLRSEREKELEDQVRTLWVIFGLRVCPILIVLHVLRQQIRKEAEEDAKSVTKIKRPKRKGTEGYIVTMTVAGSELYDMSPACPSRYVFMATPWGFAPFCALKEYVD